MLPFPLDFHLENQGFAHGPGPLPGPIFFRIFFPDWTQRRILPMLAGSKEGHPMNDPEIIFAEFKPDPEPPTPTPKRWTGITQWVFLAASIAVTYWFIRYEPRFVWDRRDHSFHLSWGWDQPAPKGVDVWSPAGDASPALRGALKARDESAAGPPLRGPSAAASNSKHSSSTKETIRVPQPERSANASRTSSGYRRIGRDPDQVKHAGR